MIDHSRLLELLAYCPTTGVFTRKVALSNRTKVGDVAGNLNNGYVELSVDGQIYAAHELAWFYVHGAWPSRNLDHIDLDRANNAIHNLRPASFSQNGGNMRLDPRSSTKRKGVTAYGGRFKASIMVRRKRYHLGVFDSADEAAAAYDAAAISHFGAFALTNRKLGLI